MDWFVVRTKASQELRAIHHMKEQGFDVYCPVIPKYDGLKEVTGNQILFPGYCFLQNDERSVTSIRSTPGVIALVSFGAEGKHASVSGDVLEEIRRVEASYSQKIPGLRSGDVVNLTDGPFKGLQGLYSKRSKERIEVLMTVLGRQQRVLVPSSHVVSAEAD